MDFSNSFEVGADISTVWDFFENEPEAVGMCIPGAQTVTKTGPDKFHLIVRQTVGHLHATFDLHASIEEKHPVEAMRLSAAGRSIKGARTDVRAIAEVKLSQPESVTQVQIDSKVTLTGVAASLGGRVLAKRTAEVIAEFAAGLQRRICPAEADPGNG